MSFDQSNKRYQPLESSLDSSRFHNALRSPEGNMNASILRNRNESFHASSRGRSGRSHQSFSKKVSYADIAGSTTANLSKGDVEPQPRRSTSRKTTPKKYYFFSEYLNDYAPSNSEYRSPTSANPIRSGLPDRSPLKTTALNSSGHVTGALSGRKEYTSSVIERREPIIRGPDATESYTYKNWKQECSPRRKLSRSPVRDNDEIERRLKDNKKEQIKERLSRLSEKLHSPLKSSIVESKELPKEGSFVIKDYIPSTYPESFGVPERAVTDSNSKLYKSDISSLDVRQRIQVKDYENSINSLKSHLEKVERSNTDIVSRLREELKNAREELAHRKQDASAKINTEVKNLNEHARDLEEHLRQERDRIREFEEKIEDQKVIYEKKISESLKEFEKIKNEKERKVDELQALLKNQTQTQKDAVNKIRAENEVVIKKLREEQAQSINELHSELQKKQAELEKVQREKAEALKNLNEKVGSLQELTKGNQDTYNKLTRTLSLKDDEIEKLNRRLQDTKKDGQTLNKKVEELELDKAKLEEENERLKSKAARLEKMIYGKGKKEEL